LSAAVRYRKFLRPAQSQTPNSITVQRSCAGFTIVEAIIAVAMIGLIGLAIGRVFTGAGSSLFASRERQRAVTLSNMIFEQYKALARVDPGALASVDRTAARPREFFGTPDDLGFDDLRVSANSHPAPGNQAVEILLTIAWGAGKDSRSSQFRRLFSSGNLAPAEGAAGSGI
jgi:type II secretory pathway pseudopilin PulG